MANSLGGEGGRGAASSADANVSADEARRKAASFSIADLRVRLLDTSARNNRIAFRHTEPSRNHPRAVDTPPNLAHEPLADCRTLKFMLPPPPHSEPPSRHT